MRHRFVRDFTDRFHQAFGYRGTNLLFRTGWLFGPDGRQLPLALGPDGIFDREGRQQASVHERGCIRVTEGRRLAGYASEGVVLDEEGDAMAVVEMATGIGVPDDFYPASVPNDPRYPARQGPPLADESPVVVPQPSGRWSERSLIDHLKGMEETEA